MPKAFLAEHIRTRAIRPFNRVSTKSHGVVWVPGLIDRLHDTFFAGFKRPAKIRSGGSTKKTGVRVHAQIEKIVNGEKVPRMHAYTKDILARLKKMDLTPIASEVPLLSMAAAFLTRSDLICRRVGGLGKGVVVVSLKTGYNQAYTRSTKTCQVLTKVPNCFKTHHQLQLACEVDCLRREYDVDVDGAYVLYVGYGKDKKTKVDALDKWDMKTVRKAMLARAREQKLPLPHTFRF